MNKIKAIALALVVAAAGAMPATAKTFAFGPKVGVTVANLHFNKDIVNQLKDNRTGFTAGLMGEVNLPIVGLGVDLSAMYVNRGTLEFAGLDEGGNITTINQKQQYIAIPLNIKYKFNLPVVGQYIAPYIFTGPEFAFRCSKDEIKNFYENKSCDISWNFGIGIQFVDHLQIGASYGLGLGNTIEQKVIGTEQGTEVYSAKNRCWTLTAAYLF